LRGILRNRKLILVIWTLVVCVGMILACRYLAVTALRGMFADQCPPSNPAAIESLARFKLPPSASNLWTQCWGLQGWWAYARFDIAPSDVDALVSSTQIKPPLSARDKPTDVEFPDVNLAEIASFLYGSHLEVVFNQEILIDTSDQQRYTVYFATWGGD
jgi:hypothetical protein